MQRLINKLINIYLVQDKSKILVISDSPTCLTEDMMVYKRKLNRKSHNFTVPKKLFDEEVNSNYIASFIFVPSESIVLIEFS